MYFPYLFGKQSEFLALRAASDVVARNHRVVPIVEPVQKSPAALIRFIRAMQEASIRSVVILNPGRGDFKDGGSAAWRKDVVGAISECSLVYPGYCCHPSTTPARIEAFLSKYSERRTALLYSSPPLSAAEMKTLASREQVDYHVCLQNKLSASNRGLLPKKKRVDVVDSFNKLARNADYGEPEFFSDRYARYKTDSVGFGDYTVIGAQYQPGGGQPAAVVVHATYRDRSSNSLWVEHFVSDDTIKGVGRVEDKYLQAVTKLGAAVAKRPREFGRDAAIAAYMNDLATEHFPGLGKNKERQIQHHVELVDSVIGGGA